MMKDRIYRAINEGINKALIDFNDDNTFKKTGQTRNNLKEFHFGDYVLYDPKVGYNNYIGDIVAVCVNDDPLNMLYAVIGHQLSQEPFSWAVEGSNLYNAVFPDTTDGWENTLYILKNFSDELDGTIWEMLNENEYIPSKEELDIIYKNCENTDLMDVIFRSRHDKFWSSSLKSTYSFHSWAYYIKSFDGILNYYAEQNPYYSVVLLHI